jgi:5'-nucleotidase
MNIKRILLTGDDGYNAIGIRLMVHLLKNEYELLIAGTKEQQSGVGGKLSIFSGGNWGTSSVDGVKAIWVSGTPGDAIECARSFYRQKFDLAISGINLGLNVCDCFTSGTVAAAWRSVKLNLTDRAIAFSWDAPVALYNHDHKGKEKITDFLTHPGAAAKKVLNLAIKNNFWNSSLLNINFPKKLTKKIKFTQFLPHISDYYPDIDLYQGSQKKYSYPKVGAIKESFKAPDSFDAWAVNNGYISLTPCTPDLGDLSVYQKHSGKEITF